MQREKVRVYALARELNVESKDLLDLCRQAGFDVKNQLSSLDPDQRDLVEQLVKKGGLSAATAVAAPPKSAAPVIPQVMKPLRDLSGRPPRRESEARPATPPSAEGSPAPAEVPAAPASAAALGATPAVGMGLPTPPAAGAGLPTPPAAAAKLSEAPQTRPPESPPGTTPRPVDAPAARVADPGKIPSLGGSGNARVPDLGGQVRSEARPQRKREIPRPVVARVATPPPLKARPAPGIKKPQEPVAQKPIMRLSNEALKGGPVNLQDMLNKASSADVTVPVEIDDEEARKSGRPGGVAGRDKRHQQRADRAKQRKGRTDEEQRVDRLVLTEEDQRPSRLRQRLHKHAQAKLRSGPTQPRKGKLVIEPPITVRALSEAIGVRGGELLFKLLGHGAPANLTINSVLEPELAETVAIEYGADIEFRRTFDAEAQVLSAFKEADNPEDLEPRAPVVTIMGHVDHGKTSLLDRIRKSDIVATEAGGITQVIRAWRVEHGGHPITFLDTPGHEAFTKMRARGAKVTDIAVIVVAADDGVMPQTEEAISHAKAAGVPIVVAINKVDLPNANLNKTRQQLYGLGLIPDNMGGDVPFIETSAATGKGIDDLLDNLSVVAETLLELKANPHKAASGTCLEAMLSEGKGVQATLLVQDGTLHRGDVLVCGASYGRVRALYDDMGRPIEDAEPSVPVRITGLDEVPNADDPFLAVPDLATAREIADKRKQKQQEATLFKREPVKLESLSQIQATELKVILKADFRGSIEAIRKELEKLHHEEVRVRILHAAIGGITESDVHLALTSPQDTIIVGFNVVPDDRARALAEEKGVQIRQYDIIYNLTDDIRSALEGKLKPREEIVHLGRAVVRDTFKISRVGTIAGCYVTQGTIERAAKVRVIREGIVIYPPVDRTAGLESLKRFKDDVREVREGFECGIKIAGYDDIKVGDVIEAYRIEQVQRTL